MLMEHTIDEGRKLNGGLWCVQPLIDPMDCKTDGHREGKSPDGNLLREIANYAGRRIRFDFMAPPSKQKPYHPAGYESVPVHVCSNRNRALASLSFLLVRVNLMVQR